jgi:ferredoxin-nitrate reductase
LDAPARLGDIREGEVFIPFHYGYWDEPGRSRAANELTLYSWTRYPSSRTSNMQPRNSKKIPPQPSSSPDKPPVQLMAWMKL